jgi:hypothetical protein
MIIPVKSRWVSRMFDAYGKLFDMREYDNFLTEFGEANLAELIANNDGSAPIAYMGIGTGSGQTRASTALATQQVRQVLDSTTQGAGADDNDITFSCTYASGTPGSAFTFTEAGLFELSTGSNMINYVEFSPGRFKAASGMTWQLDCVWTLGHS